MMRYCIGYLDHDEVISFLQKMSKFLHSKFDEKSKENKRESFIIVQDNVVAPDMKEDKIYGQMVRRENNYLRLFSDAGLQIRESTRLRKVHEDMMEVKIWVLSPENQINTS